MRNTDWVLLKVPFENLSLIKKWCRLKNCGFMFGAYDREGFLPCPTFIGFCCLIVIEPSHLVASYDKLGFADLDFPESHVYKEIA
jgi:hypothetical protein